MGPRDRATPAPDVRRTETSSRERVLAAIRHVEPDRIPIDLGSTASSGISAITYEGVARQLGLVGSHTRIYEPVQELAEPEDPILERFGVDVVDLTRAFTTSPDYWYDFALPEGPVVQYPKWFHALRRSDGSVDALDDSGMLLATRPRAATFFDQTVFPYVDGYPSNYRDLTSAMSRVQWAAFSPSPWDHDAAAWGALRAIAAEYRESSGKAIVVSGGYNLFEWGCLLRRNDQFLADLIEQPTEVERLLDALVEAHLCALERLCAAVGDLVDVIRLSDDLGTNDGPFMSPAMYRRFFKPRHTVLCEYIRSHSGMHPMLHSCGSVYSLIPDLIDVGFEVLNPIQISARDMQPDRLKREFGQDLTFWGGGADTRRVLISGSPDDVKNHVRALAAVFARGGGFVLSATHNLLPDIPPRNVVAMYEAALESDPWATQAK